MDYIVCERDSFEERNHSSTSFLDFDPQIDLSSLDNSTMAHMLVRQQPSQQTLRTPNMSILPKRSTNNRNFFPISRSVDDRIFYLEQNPNTIVNFFQKVASEPRISMYHSTSNAYTNKNLLLSPSFTNTFLSLNDQAEEEQEQNEANTINCDTIQLASTDDIESDTLDTISSIPTDKELNKDITLDTISSSNLDRHFRRRKRRSSWTPSVCSPIDEQELVKTDVIEKIENNQGEKSQTIDDTQQPISLENLPLEDNNTKKEDTSEEYETSLDTKIVASRLRSRRTRFRSSRQTIPSSEPILEENGQFFLATETPAISTPIPTPSTPPPSPTSPTPSFITSSNTLPGGLKRNGSVGTTKKMVRFADTVGQELTQVQYIRSITDDDSKDFHLAKNNLYVPTVLNFEPKPWSFDVAWTSKQLTETRAPKRFFCLYRQPNSEHPDIYLHEVWKSQIKLEHADIRLKSSLTNEQYLHGTAWVTNAGYWKNVTVKYSFNRWLNTYEYDAQHRCHSNDFRNLDLFEFSIDIPQDIDRIDFVIRYQVNGQEYWDNNEGKNYTLETESSTIPQTTISLPHDCDFNEMRFY